MATTDLVTEILTAPAGRAFLLAALESGLSVQEIAKPAVGLELSVCAVHTVSRWRADRSEILDMLFQERRELDRLASALLASPATAGWFSPLDRTEQVWLSDDGNPPLHALFGSPAPPSTRELYAQKCAGGLYTTTLVEGTSALHAVLAYGTGDIPARFQDALLTLFRLRIRPQVRVFEVNGPRDWHDLSLRYPARAEDGRLTPDWSRVAIEWHGVHVTLGGVLLAEQVRTTSAEGWSQFESWDFEQTLWLHWVFEEAECLGDLPWPLPRTSSIRMLWPS